MHRAPVGVDCLRRLLLVGAQTRNHQLETAREEQEDD
jgi:hypothetical protein